MSTRGKVCANSAAAGGDAYPKGQWPRRALAACLCDAKAEEWMAHLDGPGWFRIEEHRIAAGRSLSR